MHLEAFREYCLSKKGATEGFPFDRDTLVFKVMDKMFAVVPLERQPARANLKCDPERALALRESYDGRIFPGYHMSKTHWNTIYLEQLPEDLVRELTDHSYDLVVTSLPRKKRQVLESMQ